MRCHSSFNSPFISSHSRLAISSKTNSISRKSDSIVNNSFSSVDRNILIKTRDFHSLSRLNLNTIMSQNKSLNNLKSRKETGTQRAVREGLRGAREPIISALKSYSDRVEETLSSRKDNWITKLEVLYRTLSMMKRGHRDEQTAIERCEEAITALSELHKAEVENMGSSTKTDTLAGYIAAMEILVLGIKDDTKHESSGGRLRFSESALDNLLKGYSKMIQEGQDIDSQRQGDLVPATKEYLLSTANTFQKFEKPKLAEKVLKTLQRNNPKDTTISFTLGKLYENTRNFAHAIAEYESIVATTDKSFTPAYFRLGRCWQIFSEPQKAIDNLEKFLSYSKGRRDTQILKELASLYSAVHNFDRAHELFEELHEETQRKDIELQMEWMNSMAKQLRMQSTEKSKLYEKTIMKMEQINDNMQKIAPNDWRTFLANMHVAIVMKNYDVAWTWIMAAWEVVIEDARKQQQKQELLEKKQKQKQAQNQNQNQQKQKQKPQNISSNVSDQQNQISQQQKDVMLTIAVTAFHYAVTYGAKSETVQKESKEFRKTFMNTEMFDRQVLAYIRPMMNEKIITNEAQIFDVILEVKGTNEENGEQSFLRKYQVISTTEDQAVKLAQLFEADCQNTVAKVERVDTNHRITLDPEELGTQLYEGVSYASGRILFERQ